MKRKQYIKSSIAFLLLIFVFPIIIFFSKKESFSEIENRPLEEFPELSLRAIGDKSYMNGIESYLSDHFPVRVGWVKAKLGLEMLTGKELINGIYITDDSMYEKLPEPDYDEIQVSVDAINEFAGKYKNTKVFMLLAPTSAGIYEDRLADCYTQINQRKFIDDVYSKLGDNVGKIDIYDAMYSARDEYIYYRTDHHWTSEGAFTAYKCAAGEMGFMAYEDHDIEAVTDEFRGTFYSKCLYDSVEPDCISIYKPKNNLAVLSVTLNDGIKEETTDDIYFKEFLDTNDKYCVFLGRNRTLTKIKTNSDTGRKLLIVKDSYANSFVPFMVQNYSEIGVIDLRYVKNTIKDFVDPDEYDHTIFLYNASTFSTDKNVRNIGL